MEPQPIPFNRPHATGRELDYIGEAIANGLVAGDGPFTRRCHALLEQQTETAKALLTHSCTAALEMSAILAEVQPGDEIIMPAYTFVSTANAFVLRGAVPVFVDIREDTLNIDEQKIHGAITGKTRAIVAVHYAGVGCEMDEILAVARQHRIPVIEDAAQGVMASYKGRPLGSLGDFGCFSFHESKNIISGEGGALLVNDSDFIERAEIIREKGTNRSKFFRGEIDKYTWCDIGSSYLPSELTAAFLTAQLEDAEAITKRRLALWSTYHEAFEPIEAQGRIRRPVIPDACEHNGHMYYLLLPDGHKRPRFIKRLRELGIHAVFHYVPLHRAPQGLKCSRSAGDLSNTEDLAERVVRLPLWPDLGPDQSRVIEAVTAAVREIC